jgi:hypothetical protein
MKLYTQQEIEKCKQYFEESHFPYTHTSVGDLRFSYFVLPSSLEPSLKHFVFQMIGEDTMLFGISEDVPSQFRDYALAHEILEFTRLWQENKPCTKALEQELVLVPARLQQEYCTMRRDFFQDLYQYTAAFPEMYSEERRVQFLENARTLDRIVK